MRNSKDCVPLTEVWVVWVKMQEMTMLALVSTCKINLERPSCTLTDIRWHKVSMMKHSNICKKIYIHKSIRHKHSSGFHLGWLNSAKIYSQGLHGYYLWHELKPRCLFFHISDFLPWVSPHGHLQEELKWWDPSFLFCTWIERRKQETTKHVTFGHKWLVKDLSLASCENSHCISCWYNLTTRTSFRYHLCHRDPSLEKKKNRKRYSVKYYLFSRHAIFK